MSKYQNRLREHLTKVILPSVIKSNRNCQHKDRKLINSIKMILHFYEQQINFFKTLSENNEYFKTMLQKFQKIFAEIVKFEIIDAVNYQKNFKHYFSVVFEKWKFCINQNFTCSQIGIEAKDVQKYSIMQTLIPPDLDPNGDNINFDFSELKKFIRFHEVFGLTGTHLKPNLTKFYVSELIEFLDILVQESEDLDEDEEIEDYNNEHFEFLMPFLQIFSSAYLKMMGEKIDEYRQGIVKEELNLHLDVVKNFKTIFSLKYLGNLERDLKFVFIRKMGGKILDLVLDMPNTLSRIKEISLYISEVNMTEEICLWLKQAIEARLLSPGVTTENILISYFNIVKTLRRIDPNLLNFRMVTTPVKNFLLKRSDLIKCIIAYWKGERGGDLSSNEDYIVIPIQEEGYDSSSDEDVKAAENWNVRRFEDSRRQKSKLFPHFSSSDQNSNFFRNFFIFLTFCL